MASSGDGFADMVLVGNHLYKIGIPYKYPRRLKEKLLAGLVSESLGLKTLERSYKDVKEEEIEFDNGEEFNWKYDKIRKIKNASHDIADLIRVGPGVTLPFNMFLALATLLRLPASFSSIRYLIMNGFYFETYSILRLAFEQLAYANKLSTVPEEKVKEIIPTMCINELKKHFPMAGKVYGHLSEVTHIPFSRTREFFGTGDTGEVNGDSIVLQSPKNTYELLYHTFGVLDVYEVVTEWVFRDYLQGFNAWDKIGTDFKIRTTRKYSGLAEEIQEKWKAD
jgi:hypothetical protein